MIPVELRLHNFLSYGTAAPVLDFAQFHVACLSGRNGQGKSALLDAITWALWGEARKSSDSRKPDEELIRIGSRRMEVELVFDVEGTRYRVTRSFSRSATGKTSKPGLELQVFDAETSDYRPLTTPSIRETQTELSARIGLDYDTFINSAFLLQGRSDEFTKKKPSERKQILAKILDLSRYGRLADRAREHERTALARFERAEHEIERLTGALADEPAWKALRTEVEAVITEAAARLEALRAEEKSLTERLATLDGRAREAASVREALARLDDARRRDEAEAEDLTTRLARAEALIAERQRIERDFARREALTKERTALEEKQHLDRALEDQIRQREADLTDRRNEMEKKLDRLRVEIESDERALNNCETDLAEAPSVVRQLAAARQAKERLDGLTARRDARRRLEADIATADRALLEARAAREADLKSLAAALAREPDPAPRIAQLTSERARLQADAARLAALRAALEKIRLDGQAIKEAIEERKGRMEARRAERAKQAARLDAFRALDTSECPTCGSALTAAHRATVERDFSGILAGFDREAAEDTAWLAEREQARAALREAYKAQATAIADLDGVEKALAEVETNRAHAEEARAERLRKQAAAATLRRTLEDGSIGQAERVALDALRARLAEIDFDEAAYEAARTEAAGLKHLEERHRRLEHIAGRKEQLAQQLANKRPEHEALQTQLAEGTVFAPMREQIRRLTEQRGGIGFDPRRLEDIRRALGSVEKAGEDMQRLVQAQQEQPRFSAKLAECRARLAAATAEHTALCTKLEGIEAALGDRTALAAAQREKAEASALLERDLSDRRVQLGELNSRLEQARTDRATLQLQRKAHADAKADRALYKHLRAAFGRHGIPSLIIEQTLPEIEERANELLDRLTDGRMHVQLDTLKDKKSGGTKETLEIIITDEQGVPRPYETFSGGEAFRVNFALRIALARLLAERSGVRIRTLVIDEGFGTQDEQGVENLVEAIQTIQDDFDKILVITHLDQLKAAFPVRIEVEKDPVMGSRFEMIGI